MKKTHNTPLLDSLIILHSDIFKCKVILKTEDNLALSGTFYEVEGEAEVLLV